MRWLAFGIPLITSDIDVCKEVFESFENVFYIDNYSNVDIKLLNIDGIKNNKFSKNNKFMKINTIDKEIELFNQIFEKGKK
ncbi:hypothetical protein Q5M85_12090 [Paraclostridium bifermentans]|nr:hypothetical protein [Paraclostridium bifermentans]